MVPVYTVYAPDAAPPTANRAVRRSSFDADALCRCYPGRRLPVVPVDIDSLPVFPRLTATEKRFAVR